MDSLCLKTASTISAAIPIDVVSANQKRSTTTPFSRFSFKYPLKSLWPGPGAGGGRGPTYNGNGNGNGNGMALHDAVPLEVEEARESGNWVLKILHVRSLWGGGGGGGGGDEQAEQPPPVDQPAAINDTRTCDCDCDDGCPIEQDQDLHFDKHSFSRFLRKVSLAEARLYAQMSYLGSLAYSIPKIQVRTNHFMFSKLVILDRVRLVIHKVCILISAKPFEDEFDHEYMNCLQLLGNCFVFSFILVWCSLRFHSFPSSLEDISFSVLHW